MQRSVCQQFNTDLLIKRLRIMDMPNDVIGLIREWLLGRSFYVQNNLGQSLSQTDKHRQTDKFFDTIYGGIWILMFYQ